MLTKKDIVARIQEAANFHLGHKALDMSPLLRKTKHDLIITLAIAEAMKFRDEKYYALKGKYSQATLDAARLFPQGFEGEQVLEDIKEMDRLRRESGDLWLTI